MANKKITELTEVSSFTSDGDLIPIVINTDTTPSNASISKANIQNAIGGKDNLTTANISGATNLDWNFTVHKLTATASVTFSDINLPAHPKTITIYLTGAFPITVPSEWNLDLADYDGSVYNRITIDYVESGFYSADLKVLS